MRKRKVQFLANAVKELAAAAASRTFKSGSPKRSADKILNGEHEQGTTIQGRPKSTQCNPVSSKAIGYNALEESQSDPGNPNDVNYSGEQPGQEQATHLAP